MELFRSTRVVAIARRWAGILCVVGMIAGCQEKIPETQIEAESKLRPLARMYAEFINQNRRMPPKDEQQFKAFLEKRADVLNGMSVDDFLTSARDKERFVVSYGKLRVSPQGTRIIAYEKTGVDGKRYIADDLGVVELVDEARFKQMVPDGP